MRLYWDKRQLIEQIKIKRSFLCVGLDTEIEKIPKHLLLTDDPVFEFNKAIIKATSDLCIAYKPNWAYYEAMGINGMNSLQKTLAYIPNDCMIIADAKRGDIDTTASRYAKAFYDGWNVDAVTLSPYMGQDSIMPYLTHQGKYAILLGLTSNSGANDIQLKKTDDAHYIFEEMIATSKVWGNPDNMMYVVGATKAEYMMKIRKIIPDHFWLVPGIGAQGGNFEEVIKYGINDQVGLIINNTRGIIYQSSETDFDVKARAEALKWQQKMEPIVLEKFALNS